MFSDDNGDDIIGPAFGSFGDTPVGTSTAPSVWSHSDRNFGTSQDTTLTASVELRLESGMPSTSDMSHADGPLEDHPCSAIVAEDRSMSGLSMRSGSLHSTNTTRSTRILPSALDFESEYSWSHFGKGVIHGFLLLLGGYKDKDTERTFVTRQFIGAYSIPMMTVSLLIQMTFSVFGLGHDSIDLIWPIIAWATSLLVGILAIWRQVKCVLDIKRDYQNRIEAAANQDKPDSDLSRRPGMPEWCTSQPDVSYRLVLTESPCNASTVSELEYVTLGATSWILLCNIAIWMALVSRVSWAGTSPPIQVMVFGAPFTLVAFASRLRFNRLVVGALIGVAASISVALIERYGMGRAAADSNSDFILSREYLAFHLVAMCGCLGITAAREYVAREHFRRIADVDNAMKRLEMYTRGTRRLLEDRLPQRALGRFLTGETIHDTAKDASVICIAFSSSGTVDTLRYIRALAMLNRDIDNEARNHRVDKATVNGDAYWGTCGLCDPSVSLQHSLKMMNFALSVLEWHPYNIKDGEDSSPDGIEMRIGLHCASMASTIFGAATQGLDVVGSGVSVAKELTHYAMVGGTVATDAFMINLGRQTGPSIMDRYSQSFSRVQLQCTKLPIRIAHITSNILDGECVSPLLEIHGHPQTDPVTWFFNSQINPYLRVSCQAQYLLKLMKPRTFRIAAELGLGRKRRHRPMSSGGVPDHELDELSPTDVPNPLNPWTGTDRAATSNPQEVDASDYHTSANRRVQLCAAIALMVQSFVLLILILTTGTDETLSGIVLVCLGGFLCAILCNILVLVTPRLPADWVSFMSTAVAMLAMVLILVGVVSLNTSDTRGDVSHIGVFIITVWPSLSMLHRRLLSATSLLITILVVAGILASAQAESQPLAFVYYTFFVIVAFAVPLWFDHHFRSEVTLIEEHCLVWGINVTEQSRCILWSLLKTLIPKHLLVLMLESYGLSGVLDPVALDESVQEAHNRYMALRKSADENFPGPSILRSPSLFYWKRFAVGAFRLSELMSAQQILAADLFQHISFTHQQLLSVMDACRHVSLLRAFGDVLLVGGYVGMITASNTNSPPPTLDEATEVTNKNATRPSSADSNRGDAIEMSPSHSETTHALLELLFVACTRMMRYRRTVSMRVGLHIGEVYGTLIGSSQVSFEFVGETISTAVAISQYAPRDRPMASGQFAAAYDRAIDEVRECVGSRDNEDDDTHPLLPDGRNPRDPVWDASANYKPFMAEWGPSVVLHSQGLQYDTSQPHSPLSATTHGPDRCLMGMELLTATPLEV